MNVLPVRSASRLWYRFDSFARTASLAFWRWRSALAPILPF